MVTQQSHVSFSPTPSTSEKSPTIQVAAAAPKTVTAIGVPISSTGKIPDELGYDRARLAAAGFDGSVGSTLALPMANGPTMIAVGVGDPSRLDTESLRVAAAAFARATRNHETLATDLASIGSIPPDVAAQAVVEGILLARYRYEALRSKPTGKPLTELTLMMGNKNADQARKGCERGRVLTTATMLARDLANTPHNHLTATRIAEVAMAIGREHGLEVEVFDKKALIEMGCGGLLAINAGSVEAPRMIKLTYRPKKGKPTGKIAFVGKGIMYDSGGLALKPGNEVHAQMKNDMSGAGAVLASMTALEELGCTNEVTGYMMCTDNVPSGTATALGDVVTLRGGTTLEITNSDAEGRVVMADALVLAVEGKNDAIVDIATLTGACQRALGNDMAGLFGNDRALLDQVKVAAEKTDERVWELPLHKPYRKSLESQTADLRNLGDAAAPGAIVAAVFLAEFVGDIPWAHLDICGTAFSATDAWWKTEGCTGFGTRLLAQIATDFKPTKAARSSSHH